MPPRQRGPWATLASPQRASEIASAPKVANAATLSTSSSTFESALAAAAIITAAVLVNYLGGVTSSLLSKIIGTWAAESLPYLLLTLASCGALFGWHKRSRGGEAASVWAGAALFALLMHRLLAASASIFLNIGSTYISTANDTEILTRWALTALFGCGGVFFFLGWAMGNALYAMPAALYAPGLCSIPIIIAAPSLAVVYPYYHQCFGTHIASVISSIFATTYLYTISTKSTSSSPSSVRNQSNVHKWRIQGQLLCILFLMTSYRTISECLHCGGTTNTSTTNSHRTGPIWRCPLQDGGVLSILENSPEENPVLRYRVMKLEHAIMGGIWISPKSEAGRPVYTTFHLQAAARLLLKNSTKEGKNKGNNSNVNDGDNEERKGEREQVSQRSLHIGLGAGTTVSVLQRRGFITDVVELYQEVIDAAKTYFDVEIGARTEIIGDKINTSGIAYAGDALNVVPTLRNNKYDLVILDVFSGGFPTVSEEFSSFYSLRKERKQKEKTTMVTELSSAAFFEQIKQKLKQNDVDGENGVLAVNYVGMKDSPELSQLVCTLKQVFISVRYFKDAEENGDGSGEEVGKSKEKAKGKTNAEEDYNENNINDGTKTRKHNNMKKKDYQLGNFVIMATDNKLNGRSGDLFSLAQREILELGEGPLDEMEVDVLSRLVKSELSMAWATREACESVLPGGGDGGGGDGEKMVKGAAQRSHRALAGLHNAAAHWKTMRIQFGNEVWTL